MKKKKLNIFLTIPTESVFAFRSFFFSRLTGFSDFLGMHWRQSDKHKQ